MVKFNCPIYGLIIFIIIIIAEALNNIFSDVDNAILRLVLFVIFFFACMREAKKNP